jgi:hypothetical protein
MNDTWPHQKVKVEITKKQFPHIVLTVGIPTGRGSCPSPDFAAPRSNSALIGLNATSVEGHRAVCRLFESNRSLLLGQKLWTELVVIFLMLSAAF